MGKGWEVFRGPHTHTHTSQHYQNLGGSLIAYAALPEDAMHIYCTSDPATEIINILLYSEMEILAPHRLIE